MKKATQSKEATQSGAYTTLLASISLEHHILAECLAMAKHAFSSGLKVPGSLTERLDAIATLELGDMSSTENPKDPNEMFANDQRGDNGKELATIHARLSEIVKPATPRTILLLATESARVGFWNFLGPVPLIRGMAIVAIICLIAFIVISLSSQVNTESIAMSIFENQGIDLLLNLLFLMTAAGLGACFAGLFQANRYIAEGTFDPKYESSYWIRFVLGLMAGMMLAELIPMPGAEGAADAAAANTSAALARPTLAMLGGFSAAVVYRIINRLIEAVESLVRGETREIIAAREQAVQARFAEQSAQSRIQLAGSLTKLQQQVSANASPEELQQELDRILGRLMPADPEEEEMESAPASQTQA